MEVLWENFHTARFPYIKIHGRAFCEQQSISFANLGQIPDCAAAGIELQLGGVINVRFEILRHLVELKCEIY